MPRITLDVALLVLTQNITAIAGDSLILYNDQIIGVVPKGTPGSPSEAAILSKTLPEFDPEKVLSLFHSQVKSWTVYEVNKKLGWTGTKVAGQCGQWMHKQALAGTFTKTEGRYPHFTLTVESSHA